MEARATQLESTLDVVGNKAQTAIQALTEQAENQHCLEATVEEIRDQMTVMLTEQLAAAQQTWQRQHDYLRLSVQHAFEMLICLAR